MIHTSRIQDNWTPKFLSVEQLIIFDRAVMVYKIIDKLCPENIWSKFNLRSTTPDTIHDSAEISRSLGII